MTVETIEWHTLHPRYLGAESIVVDLGANFGRFSRKMIARFGCRCYAVEASPTVFASIEDGDRLRKFNYAISNRVGPVPFYVRDKSLASSVIRRPGEDGAAHSSVEGLDLESFVRTVGLDSIDVLKVDIEGSEIDMLDACSDAFLSSIAQITIEFHDFCGITPKVEVERVMRRLRQLGFFAVRMSGVGHQDTWLINRGRCRISTLELLWIRLVIRNWRGGLRVLKRKLGFGISGSVSSSRYRAGEPLQ